jgi:hypothetical protein
MSLLPGQEYNWFFTENILEFIVTGGIGGIIGSGPS